MFVVMNVVDLQIFQGFIMETKKFTAGKWMGIVVFIFIILCLIVNYIIIIIDHKINLEYLHKIDLLAFGVFTIVWGAVFGSNLTKKLRDK